MIRPFDLILGASLGLLAGVLFHRTFYGAWRWGFALLGPFRPTELHAKPNHVAGRTAMRALLASLSAAVTVSATWLALSLPFRALVVVWHQFALGWVTTFLLAALVMSLRRRKDAA